MTAVVAAGRALAVLAGLAIVGWTALSAIRTVVLPRADQVPLSAFVFITIRRVFDARAVRLDTYEERDRVMALYAPVALMALPVAWLLLVFVAYAGVLYGLDGGTARHAFEASGSSLLTLGFVRPRGLAATLAAFTEAGAGVGLLALLITYLPSMYGAFSRREANVALLEVRAGVPPSGVAMIERYFRIEGFDTLDGQWPQWEAWFADLEETHTSLGALSYFRSPNHQRSWITAAGAVLDAASLYSSVVDVPRAPQANLCIRGGYVALRSIAAFFRIPFDADPRPDDPIAVDREEFMAACDRLARAGVPLRSDLDQAWRDFAGWRVNYDAVLLELAALLMAPMAEWSSDRSPPYRPRSVRGVRRR